MTEGQETEAAKGRAVRYRQLLDEAEAKLSRVEGLRDKYRKTAEARRGAGDYGDAGLWDHVADKLDAAIGAEQDDEPTDAPRERCTLAEAKTLESAGWHQGPRDGLWRSDGIDGAYLTADALKIALSGTGSLPGS